VPTKTSIHKRAENEVQNRAEVLIEGGYSEKDLKMIARVCGEGISNREWDSLKTKYKLPDRARGGIDSVILGYWDWRSDTTISKKLAPKIQAGISQTKRLLVTLSRLRNDRDFFKGFHAYYDQSPAEQALFIEEVMGSLQRLELLLKNAEERTQAPAHRPSHRAVMQALRILAELMEVHGTELTGDNDSIGYSVMRLADPKLETRAVRKVLSDLLTIRPNWAWTGLWVEDKFR
jgi:hypothetical protein